MTTRLLAKKSRTRSVNEPPRSQCYGTQHGESSDGPHHFHSSTTRLMQPGAKERSKPPRARYGRARSRVRPNGFHVSRRLWSFIGDRMEQPDAWDGSKLNRKPICAQRFSFRLFGVYSRPKAPCLQTKSNCLRCRVITQEKLDSIRLKSLRFRATLGLASTSSTQIFFTMLPLHGTTALN